MITVHTFGDSHASGEYSHWNDIKISDINIVCNYRGPKLMYSFGKLKKKLLNIKDFGVQENDIVIFCYGEIDCRNHVHKHINKYFSYVDVIDKLVINYFRAIKENVRQFDNIKVCVYNVVPPTRFIETNDDYPFIGTNEERKTYTLYMNKKLKEYCKKLKYNFFDIYNFSCDKDGFLKKNISDGNVHLVNSNYSSLMIKKISLL